jgi:hypothetical protein
VLDARLRRVIDPARSRAGAALARLGVGANAVTVGGFLVGVAAWAALAATAYPLALALILANRVADGLDGALARQHGLTDLGGYLDIVLDSFFYAGVLRFARENRGRVKFWWPTSTDMTLGLLNRDCAAGNMHSPEYLQALRQQPELRRPLGPHRAGLDARGAAAWVRRALRWSWTPCASRSARPRSSPA